MSGMKWTTWLPLAAGAMALTGMTFVFVSSSSPYVTVAQAKTASGDRLHLKGDLVKSTLRTLPRERQVHFVLRDDAGDTTQVVFHGPPPANMGEATEVVAIGSMKGDAFHANKMLLKCPSKYNAGDKKPGVAGYPAQSPQ